jgi:choline dehydrogenase-like flavoprotein
MLLSLLLQLLLLEVCAVLSIESGQYTHLVDADSSEDTQFDYVVVGGGTAGIVIATRLAQKSLKVALVESGGLYESVSVAAIPAADVIPVGSDPNTKASFDWGFVAHNIPGANGRSIHYARGKCLGGS